MHEAYELVPILEKLPLQIEAITAYDGNLVVGTRQGHLLMYSISTDSTGRLKVSLLRSNKNFSRKPITQVAVVPEHQILVSLSDQMLSVHDLAVFNFPLLTSLPKTKGAVAFDLDLKHLTSSTGEEVVTVRLVVAVRRRLQLYYWKARQFQDLREELTLPDSPRCLNWCDEAIAVAFRHDYWIVKLTGEQNELFPTGKGQEPLITKMSDNCLALERDEKTIFVDAEGNAICKYTLDWPEQPLSMVYDPPYLIAAITKAVQIQCQDPKLNIQTINLDKPKLLALSSNSKDLRQVLVASASHVWCLRPIPISQQIPELLSEAQFKLALRLADLWQENEKSKFQMKHHIEKLHAFDLFCQKEFAEAMSIFFKLNTDLLFVIGLYPGLVPEDHRNRLPYPHTVPQLEEDDLNIALKELTNFLIEKRNKIISQKDEDSNDSSPAKKSKPQMLQIIDTTLLKCYLKINDSLVMPLLRISESRVSVEEGERVLRQAQKYPELLLLLQTKGLHSKALQLLFRHSKRPESPLFCHEHTIEYLQKLGPSHLELIFEYGGWVIKAFPKEGLKIFIGAESSSGEAEQLPRPRVMNFLKKTDKSLVIPYLEHVIEEWGDTTPLLHNELIHHYREIILSSLPVNVEEGYRKKFLEREETKDKLLKFLKFSDFYTAASILVHFPPDALYEDRAVLLGRLGQHRDALKVYVGALSDVDLAVEYCHSHYTPSGPGSEVYLILLELLLNTQSKPFSLADESGDKSRGKYEDLILNLLQNYYQYFNISETLKILPDHMHLNLLQPFLIRSLCHQAVLQRQKQMSRGLSQALSDQTRTELYLQQTQSVVLSDSVFCKVCCKRFTSYSAFALLANGDIVHFSCKEFNYKKARMKKS